MSCAVDSASPAIPTAAHKPLAAPAARMRASRQRRRDGFRCIVLDMREQHIALLIRNGWLAEADRTKPRAIADATGEMLDNLRAGLWPFGPAVLQQLTGQPN